MESYNDNELNPIFDPIKKIFEFFILAIGFVGQKEFQAFFLRSHPEFKPLVETYNQEVNLRIEKSAVKSDTRLYWATIGRLMAIALFNILENSEYHRNVKSTEIYKFAKYIRDGAAHGNRFYLKHPLKNPVCWRDKKITSALNQKTVFPDFMSPASLLLLMADISKIIDNED